MIPNVLSLKCSPSPNPEGTPCWFQALVSSWEYTDMWDHNRLLWSSLHSAEKDSHPMATKVLKESCVPQRGQEEGSKLTVLKSWDIFLPKRRRAACSHPLSPPWLLLSVQDLAGLSHKRRCSVYPTPMQQLISLQIEISNIY